MSREQSCERERAGRARSALPNLRPLPLAADAERGSPHRSILRRTVSGALISTVLGPIGGCGGVLAGHWRIEKAVPHREVFCIDNADFRSDGSYAADVTLDGKSSRQEGAYEFNGFQLTLRPRAGGQRRYNATLKMNTLEVIDGERHVVLIKSKKPG